MAPNGGRGVALAIGEKRFEAMGLATRSALMSQTLRAANKAAPSRIPVLIEGESGAGKEWLARGIHRASPRANKPLVAVNCGAIPEQLVESILFGHEKGAFTGATERRGGKFREADGGTLFLDEVGELPAAAQVKLLRALQSGEIEPVGASRPVRVDVRVISATNRRLADEIEAGRFREDLYYRLGVFPLTVPSLRQRSEDIPAIAQLLVQRFAREYGRGDLAIEDDALRRLAEHNWPGNVRELENAVHRAVVMADGDSLGPNDFGPFRALTPSPASSEQTPSGDAQRLDAALREADEPLALASTLRVTDPTGALRPFQAIERDIIVAALHHCDGRIGAVARALGIGRSTLYRKLGEYGIETAKRARSAA